MTLSEALAWYEDTFGDLLAHGEWPELQQLANAARELLTIREAGALIIVPDEDGKWPAPVVDRLALGLRNYVVQVETDRAWTLYARAVLDALRDAMPDTVEQNSPNLIDSFLIAKAKESRE